jgi:nitrate/nitrite-specific signal transduction histidine kinase
LSFLNDLTLRIRDNGKGMDPDIAARGKVGHFGLAGMYERASHIRAQLTISSTDEVTDVELVVPRSIVFEQTDPAWRRRFRKLRSVFGERNLGV